MIKNVSAYRGVAPFISTGWPIEGDISTETMGWPIVAQGVKSGVNAHLRNDGGSDQ